MLQTLRPGIGKYASNIYAMVSALPWGSDETSLFTGATPAVANGDMSCVTYTTPGNFEIDLTSTGVVVINTGGVTARQGFYVDVYDISLRKWYGQTAGWVNNALPFFDGSIGAVSIVEGQTIAAVNVSSAVTDADGDVLTYTIAAGSLPPGLTLDSATGIITGTPS